MKKFPLFASKRTFGGSASDPLIALGAESALDRMRHPVRGNLLPLPHTYVRQPPMTVIR